MTTPITVTWTVEELDTDAEILDVYEVASLAEAVKMVRDTADMIDTRIALRVSDGDDHGFAYPTYPGRLPAHFSNGLRVPDRFHEEIAKLSA